MYINFNMELYYKRFLMVDRILFVFNIIFFCTFLCFVYLLGIFKIFEFCRLYFIEFACYFNFYFICICL
ncbi:Hypothetical protein BCO_0078001 [Borrelia coriaceae ATCC 43381]|uniref:Uncharacterized protein n=1 Tax=Borrelia coriaceae ATCC 43381 TaxID=1408429 RepID=W5SUE6_9SPIR|nr:Hypothetical protein BCO_0078001 [Borrelia coriaceae ATCC 43381]